MSTEEYNTYAIGQVAVLEGYYVDEDGAPASPVGAHIYLKVPGGVESELAITEDPVGHIFHEYRVPVLGVHHYRIITVDDAEEKFFVGEPSAFALPLGP